MPQGTELRAAEEDQRRNLPNYDIQIFDLAEESGVEEEEKHVDESLQHFVVIVCVLLAVEGDYFADVVVDHFDEFRFVLFGQLQ